MEESITDKNLIDGELTNKYANFFVQLLGAVKQAVIATDLNGLVIYWNRFAEELYGWQAEEVIGKNILEINTLPMSREQADEIMSRLGRGENWEGDFVVKRKNGEHFLAHVANAPIYDEKQKLVGIVGFSLDKSESRLAEEALLRSEEKYRTLFNSVDEGFCTIEVLFDESDQAVDYRFLEMNPAFVRQTGIENGAGRTVREFAPEHEKFWFETYGRIALTGEAMRFEHKAAALNRYYDVYAFRIGAPGEKQVAVIFNDISGRKQGEERQAYLLRLSDALRPLSEIDAVTQTVAQTARDYFKADRCFFCELEGDIVRIRHDARRADLPSVADVYSLSEMPLFKSVSQTGQPVVVRDTNTSEIIDDSLKQLCLSLNILAFINVPVIKNDELIGFFCLTQGTSREWNDFEIELAEETAERTRTAVERARAVEALRDSEQRLKRMVNVPRVGVLTFDYTGNLLHANDAFLDLVGYSRAELEAGDFTWLDFTPPEYIEASERVMESLLETGRGGPYEKEYFRKNGSRIWMMFVASNLGDGTIVVYAVEISDRKSAEEGLRRSEENFRTLFESMEEGYVVAEAIRDKSGKMIDYRFLQVNPAFEKLTGLDSHQTLGKTAREILPGLDQKRFEIYQNVIDTRETAKTEDYIPPLNKWYSITAFYYAEEQFAVLFDEITARKTAEIERERLLKAVEAERSLLAYIFERSPAFVCILRGEQHVYEITNPAYQKLIGHRQVIGKTVREALPDISGQGYYELLDKVYQTGEPYIGRESVLEFQYAPESRPEKKILNFVYQPIFEPDGTVSGIFTHGVDITEQVEARKNAEHANRLKDEFLATLSHELRTPLSSILGWTGILLSSENAAGVSRKAIETIDRNAKAQKQLIDDILDVSRIISGKLRLEISPIEMTEVITAAIEIAGPAIDAKNIRLQTMFDPNLGVIFGDPGRLQQVAWNLISNAVKFTDQDGRIEVRLERVNSHVELIISDTGQGIEPEFLPFVFDRFRQSDGSTTRRHSGLGLGLAIVRQIVEMHGGTVGVTSQGLGKGSAFTVTLPVLPIPPESEIITGLNPTVEVANESYKQSASQELAGLQLLVVDDETDSRELLSFILKLHGAFVTEAGSAAEAFEIIQNEDFDVVISDVGMPDEDGFSLIEKIRNLPEGKARRIPAIALTAYTRPEDRIKALRAGFQLHLAKPVENSELIVSVAMLSGRKN
jgi:PAS domain S-box-containing protein